MTLWSKLPLGWRLALGTGVPWGLLMATYLGFLGIDDAARMLSVVAIGSVVYGLTMATILGGLQVLGATRAGAEPLGDGLAVHQTSVHWVQGQQSAAMATVRRALACIGVAEVLEEAPDRIVVRTQWSLWSWGEHISVDLLPAADGVQVELQSRPLSPNTMVDYGRNASNLRRITRTLVAAHASTDEDATAETRTAFTRRTKAQAARQARVVAR